MILLLIGHIFNHLIYRYLEVPACGSTLVAQKVPGVEKYFKPDIDFLSYSNTKEAVDIIVSHLNDPMKLLTKLILKHKKRPFLL